MQRRRTERRIEQESGQVLVMFALLMAAFAIALVGIARVIDLTNSKLARERSAFQDRAAQMQLYPASVNTALWGNDSWEDRGCTSSERTVWTRRLNGFDWGSGQYAKLSPCVRDEGNPESRHFCGYYMSKIHVPVCTADPLLCAECEIRPYLPWCDYISVSVTVRAASLPCPDARDRYYGVFVGWRRDNACFIHSTGESGPFSGLKRTAVLCPAGWSLISPPSHPQDRIFTSAAVTR